MSTQIEILLTGLPVTSDFKMENGDQYITSLPGTNGQLSMTPTKSEALDWKQFPNDDAGNVGTLDLLNEPPQYLIMAGNNAVVGNNPMFLNFIYDSNDQTYQILEPESGTYLTNDGVNVMFLSKTGNESKQRWKFRKTVAVLTQEQPKVMN